jgi:hypothetical protein
VHWTQRAPDTAVHRTQRAPDTAVHHTQRAPDTAVHRTQQCTGHSSAPPTRSTFSLIFLYHDLEMNGPNLRLFHFQPVLFERSMTYRINTVNPCFSYRDIKLTFPLEFSHSTNVHNQISRQYVISGVTMRRKSYSTSTDL